MKVKDTVDDTVVAVSTAAKTHPELRIEQFGEGSSEEAFQEIFNEDLAKAATLSLPLTLAILLLTFGAALAAGIPLLLAITGVIATMGLVGPISHLSPVDESINHVILLIGLAVGVDYSLFYLRRMREERAAGRGKEAALEAAAATSGRAVLVSGLTVMTAMVAVLGSLTMLPALLSKMGDRVEKGRVPGLDRLKRRMAGLNIWSRVVDRVLRPPLLWAGLSTALLVALAIPALHMQTGTPALEESLPQDKQVVQTFNHVQDAFPAESSGLDIVVKADDVTAPAVTEGIDELGKAAAEDKALFPGTEAPEVDVSPDKTVATVTLEIAGDGMDDESNRALDKTRDELIPATLGEVAGVETYVDGQTAQDRDFNDTMKSNMIYVFGFVLLAAFLLLLATFRSIVVPLKAIVLNLLSVFAAYGALSMDYHVFIFSRVHELVDRGMKTDEAVSTAIKTTAGVVTSAAIVMVGVFALFGALSFMVFKQMGVGLAFAVLLDATIIRGVLLPTSMKLLGERNWWLPKSLGWLPKVEHEGEVQPAQA